MTDLKIEDKSSDNMDNSTADTCGSVFLDKVSSIPVVTTAKEYGAAAYNHLKLMNNLTNFTLTKAESTVLYLALTAKPFLEKVQPQVKMVDDIACRGLEAVEVKAPFLMKTPEEMIEEARKLCVSTLQSGYQKVDGIKTMGTDAMSSVKNYGLEKANECLTGTEHLVDRYLPPAFNEAPQGGAVADSTITERAAHLTAKLSQRVYGHGIQQFINMQRLSQESIAKLVYTIELLQSLKETYGQRNVQEYVDEAKVKATWIWEELNKEASGSEEPNKSLEHRILSLARRLTSGLVYTYSLASDNLPISGVSQTFVDGINSARSYAVDLFSQFDQAVNVGELTAALLERVRSTVDALESVVRTTVQSTELQEPSDMGVSEQIPQQQEK